MTCTLDTPIEPIYCPMGRGVMEWEEYTCMTYIPYPMLMRFAMNNFRLGLSEDVLGMYIFKNRKITVAYHYVMNYIDGNIKKE